MFTVIKKYIYNKDWLYKFWKNSEHYEATKDEVLPLKKVYIIA